MLLDPMGPQVSTTPIAPSAIQGLLGQLVPQSPAMPSAGPAPTERQMNPPGLLDRIVGSLKGLAVPEAPSGYEGLLSQQEIEQARPGVLSSLFGSPHGSGAHYEANLNRIVQMHQIAQQVQETNRQNQARTEMRSLFPAAKDETHEQRQNRLESMYAYAVQNGLPDVAKELGDYATQMAKPGPSKIVQVHGVGAVDISDPANPKLVVGEKTNPAATPGTPEAAAWQKYLASLKPDPTLVPVQQADGSVVYTPRPYAAGQAVPGKAGGASNLAAPVAARVGQFGEMLKKTAQILPIMDALDVNLGNSTAQDIAENGIGVGGYHIPGTKGLGSAMMNRSSRYAEYEAAASPLVLAIAHALSGARINKDQTDKIRESIVYAPGDSPAVKAQKRKNLVDMVNSVGGSLPVDAVAAQEAQMDPSAMTSLRGYGYRLEHQGPAAGSPAPKRALTQAQYDAGIARGHSDAEIAQHYDLSNVRRKK